MKTKYYTPSLDEFCDGVFFERKVNNRWVEEVYKNTEDLQNVRMKELDENDLLNLGFVKSSNTNNALVFTKMDPSLFNNVEIKLEFTNKLKLLTIILKNDIIVKNILIKNIQELKFLLTRLFLI